MTIGLLNKRMLALEIPVWRLEKKKFGPEARSAVTAKA